MKKRAGKEKKEHGAGKTPEIRELSTQKSKEKNKRSKYKKQPGTVIP